MCDELFVMADELFVIHQYNCALFEIRKQEYRWPETLTCDILHVICNRKIDAFVSIGDSIVKLLSIDVGGITKGIQTTTDFSVNQYASTLTDKELNGTTAEKSVDISNTSWIIHTVLDIIITLALLIAIIQCICTNRRRTQETSNNSVQVNRENQANNLNLVENHI